MTRRPAFRASDGRPQTPTTAGSSEPSRHSATNDGPPRVRTDALGPGQRFAIAAMEVCDRTLARDNEVTIRWDPAHSRVEGSEQADSYAKAAARRTAPCSNEEVPDELLTEASLSHMSRSATEARFRASAEWIASHVCPERRYRSPPGRGLHRQHLRNTRKELAGRYYQFLSGHGSFGSYLRDKVKKVDSDRCWFCDTGERQSRFHLVARCPAWARQARVM